MALLIYLKGSTQPLLMKGNMKGLTETLKELSGPEKEQILIMEAWFGQPIMFFNPHKLWSHVAEKKDSVAKKEIEDAEKAQKEKQKAMDRMQGKKVIETPGMSLLGRRGH